MAACPRLHILNTSHPCFWFTGQEDSSDDLTASRVLSPDAPSYSGIKEQPGQDCLPQRLLPLSFLVELLGFKKLVSWRQFPSSSPHLFQLENHPQQSAELKATFGDFLMPVPRGTLGGNYESRCFVSLGTLESQSGSRAFDQQLASSLLSL